MTQRSIKLNLNGIRKCYSCPQIKGLKYFIGRWKRLVGECDECREQRALRDKFRKERENK